jgi:soluble lytic murein transglycosylase
VKLRHWIVIAAVVLALASSFQWLYNRWRDHRHDKHIIAAARQYGVDPALVKAVVWRESRFNSRARGTHGEIGLMQVGSGAASEWAKAENVHLFFHLQLFDAKKNVLAGTWYLRKCLRRYQHTDNPIPYALADYNAGRANVLRWNKGVASTNSAAFIVQIDFPSTKNYVRSIMQRHEYYRPIFPPKK